MVSRDVYQRREYKNIKKNPRKQYSCSFLTQKHTRIHAHTQNTGLIGLYLIHSPEYISSPGSVTSIIFNVCIGDNP